MSETAWLPCIACGTKAPRIVEADEDWSDVKISFRCVDCIRADRPQDPLDTERDIELWHARNFGPDDHDAIPALYAKLVEEVGEVGAELMTEDVNMPALELELGDVAVVLSNLARVATGKRVEDLMRMAHEKNLRREG
jgi:NTP pyrophosphatase (non-canonical NTP hydrolase)